VLFILCIRRQRSGCPLFESGTNKNTTALTWRVCRWFICGSSYTGKKMQCCRSPSNSGFFREAASGYPGADPREWREQSRSTLNAEFEDNWVWGDCTAPLLPTFEVLDRKSQAARVDFTKSFRRNLFSWLLKLFNSPWRRTNRATPSTSCQARHSILNCQE
jgi:hypothetical protein